MSTKIIATSRLKLLRSFSSFLPSGMTPNSTRETTSKANLLLLWIRRGRPPLPPSPAGEAAGDGRGEEPGRTRRLSKEIEERESGERSERFCSPPFHIMFFT
jgi:hypothetical protein